MKKLALLGLLCSAALQAGGDEVQAPISLQKKVSRTALQVAGWVRAHPARTILLAGVMLYIPLSVIQLMRQKSFIQELSQHERLLQSDLAICQTEKKTLEDFIQNTFNKINAKLGLNVLVKKS